MSDTNFQITSLGELAILRAVVDGADPESPHDEVRQQIVAALEKHRTPPRPSRPPNREELIALCRDGFVPQERWCNRDSSAAQRQLGEVYALLRAGCDYSLRLNGKLDSWWVRVEFRGFSWFEGGGDPYGDRYCDHEEYYVPTRARLDVNAGGDWY